MTRGNVNDGRTIFQQVKETIGFLVALNPYVELDHELVKEQWRQRSQNLVSLLQGVRGPTAEPIWNTKGYDDVELSWDETIIPLTMDAMREKLTRGDPAVIVVDDVFMTRCLEEGEVLLVARRLRGFFTAEARG